MSEEKHFELLDEFIIDEKSIVTYKWLSRKLDISMKESKRLLSEYVKDISRKSKCLVTYVSIAKNTEGDMAVVISKEDDLSVVENKYGNIIAQHVYSVQQNMPNDLNILYAVDKQLERGRFEPVIKYPSDNRIKVSKQEVNFDESEEVPKVPTVAVSAENVTKNETKENVNTENELPKERSKVKEKKKTENASVSFSISKLFAKQAAKQESVKKNTVQETAKKSPLKIEKKPPLKSPLNSDSIQESPDKEKDNSNTVGDKGVKDVKKKSKKNDKKKPSKQKVKKEQKKKHKRIVLLSDSSDENEESDESEKEEVYDEPEREPTPPPVISEPACVVSYGKKRKRKVIEKTAADDEGFLHISKEVVYETCSSDDEETEDMNKKQIKLDEKDKKEKEKVDQNVVARNNGSMKTKQPSITSFFGKRSQK